MVKRDDGVLSRIEFRYERVYKVCKRCGIIDHSVLHCPRTNPKIEKMINNQMEGIHRRLEFATRYDLKSSYLQTISRPFITEAPKDQPAWNLSV